MARSVPVRSPAEETLLPFLEALATRGQQPALRYRTAFRTFHWTYDDLARLIRGFTAWYAAQGLSKGDRVLLWAPTSPNWAGAFLGAVAAGIVLVPLDLHSTRDFAQRVAGETEARLILRGRFQPEIPAQGADRILDSVAWQITQHPRAAPPEVTIRPDDLVEIVYTSGTTAAPRGVMLTQRNLASNLEAIQPIVPPEPYYRFLSLLPLSHIFEQVVGLLLPLSRGGSVTYLESLRPSAIIEAFQADRPNVAVTVPRLLDLFRARIERQAPDGLADAFARLTPLLLRLPQPVRRVMFAPVVRQFGGNLKYLVVGGAPLDRDLERFWDALGLLVLQGYGLTEAGPIIAANTPQAHRIGSVGRPVAGIDVRISRDGEVLVRGPGVTPGYFQRPEATANAFVDGYLRTGDLGQFGPQGFLYLRGRQKDVIITSAGLKVYPEDLENRLNQEPGVRDSAVLEWRGQVFAILLLDPLKAGRPARIIERANQDLNPVQRIQGWYVWPGADLPRTTTLKVQKFKIREALATTITAPASTAQPTSRVAQIISGLAPDRPVASTDRLAWDLDLSSIDRLELITLLEEEFHIDLPEAKVTDDTTVADLERLIEQSAPTRPWRPRRWPLTPGMVALRRWLQDRILFPLLSRVVWLKVEGAEHLRELTPPVIFAGNHVSNLDGPTLLMALPDPLRHHTAVAALAGFYFPPAENPIENRFHWLLFGLATIGFNVFPVPRASGFRESLRYAGWLIDHRWNILIFPEGTRSRDRVMLPFREGIGMMAGDLRVPVVPFRIDGTYQVMRRGAWLPHPGPVTIRFGPPLPGRPAPPWELTREIEEAVRRL